MKKTKLIPINKRIPKGIKCIECKINDVDVEHSYLFCKNCYPKFRKKEI